MGVETQQLGTEASILDGRSNGDHGLHLNMLVEDSREIGLCALVLWFVLIFSNASPAPDDLQKHVRLRNRSRGLEISLIH